MSTNHFSTSFEDTAASLRSFFQDEAAPQDKNTTTVRPGRDLNQPLPDRPGDTQDIRDHARLRSEPERRTGDTDIARNRAQYAHPIDGRPGNNVECRDGDVAAGVCAPGQRERDRKPQTKSFGPKHP